MIGTRKGLISLAVAFALVIIPMGDSVPGAKAKEFAFVVSTDYWSAAYYSTIVIEPPRDATVDISPVSTDPVVYYDVTEDMIFVVNRYLADNIQVVDTDPLFTTIKQYSVGNGSNPHDIRLADYTKAYVSRYEWKTLLIVHPYFGDSLGVIDLSPVADADGIPEMDRMEIVGDRLFVTLNNIDRTTWLPAGPGKIAVIDTEADTLVDCDPDLPGVQPIVLELPNPYSELRFDPCRQELIVGCLGAWGVLDGGVEAIDPFALETKGVAISEAEIGGDISDAVLTTWSKGYAVVLEAVPWPDNHARLVAFDPETRTVLDTLCEQTSGTGSSLAGIELNRQLEIYLCDRDLTQPGVRVYDTVSDTLITFVDVGVPPFDIAFLQQPFAGADDGADPHALERQTVVSSTPNPFRSSTQISYRVPDNTPAMVHLSIYDVLGRRVRTLVNRSQASGTYTVEWHGEDGHSTPVAGGVYFVRFSTGSEACTQRIILLR